MKIIAINKHCDKLKIWSVEMLNAPYSNRYGQGKKRHRTMKEILLANRKQKGNATAQA